MASIPQNVLDRKHEITTQFLDALDQHIEDILEGKVEQAYKISDFADLLSIQPAHLSNTIKVVTKRSPSEFLEERLVAEAQKMLSESALEVDEIAHRLTFHDAGKFAKFFKRAVGKTPHEFRNRFAESERLTSK